MFPFNSDANAVGCGVDLIDPQKFIFPLVGEFHVGEEFAFDMMPDRFLTVVQLFVQRLSSDRPAERRRFAIKSAEFVIQLG